MISHKRRAYTISKSRHLFDCFVYIILIMMTIMWSFGSLLMRWNVNPTTILTIALFFLFIFRALRSPLPRAEVYPLPFRHGDVLLILFVIWVLFSYTWGSHDETSRSALIRIITIIGLYFLIQLVLDKESAQSIVRISSFILLLGTILPLILSRIQPEMVFSEYPIHFLSQWIRRLRGFMENPNVYAQYALLVWGPLFVGFQTQEKSFSKLLYLFTIFLVSVAIFLSWSRGAWVAVIITTGFSTIGGINLKSRFRHVIPTLVLIFVAVVVLNLILPGWLSTTDLSNSQRLNILNPILKNWLNEPLSLLLGTGIGTTTFVMEELLWYSGGIHNVFLYILWELGLIGLLLFTSWVVFLIYDLYNALMDSSNVLEIRRIANSGLITLINIFVFNLTHNFVFSLPVIFFVAAIYKKSILPKASCWPLDK